MVVCEQELEAIYPQLTTNLAEPGLIQRSLEQMDLDLADLYSCLRHLWYGIHPSDYNPR